MSPLRRWRAALDAFLIALLPFCALAADDALLCHDEIARLEQRQGLPDHLLQAISLVESGRWDSAHRANLAWPWTINAEGEGRFLPSKQAAIAEVMKLRARGVRNIDVGCMQINLLAHPDAFSSLDEAFDPPSNVAYAGRFLADLHSQDGNWPQAGAHYHSQTPELAAPYKTRLLAVWEVLRHQGEASLQLAALDLGPQQHMPLGLLFQMAAPSSAPTAEPAAKADPLGRPEQERLAAKKAADAFRQAKLDAYLKKKSMSGT